MKRNGFTLVELLAVISVLALLIIITFTNGFGIFNKAKSGIDKIEEGNLLEAAKTFLVDVENGLCENDTSYEGICTQDYKDNYQSVPVSYLIKYYMNNEIKHCDGSKVILVKIETENEKVVGYSAKKTDDNDVICKN